LNIEWNDKTFRVGGETINADYRYFCRKFENDQALQVSHSQSFKFGNLDGDMSAQLSQ